MFSFFKVRTKKKKKKQRQKENYTIFTSLLAIINYFLLHCMYIVYKKKRKNVLLII